MAEYEPDDSRIVTQNPSSTPIEPKRTGPKEGETRGGKENQDEPVESSRSEEEQRWQVGTGKD